MFFGAQTWNGVQWFDSAQAADIVNFVDNGGFLYITARAGYDNLLSQFGVTATGNDGGSSGFNWPLIELSATSFTAHPYTNGLTSIVGDVGASFTTDANWTVLAEDNNGTDLLVTRNYGQGEIVLWYGQRSHREPNPSGNVYETDVTEGSNTQFFHNLFGCPLPLGPPWYYTNTGNNHTILIPQTATITVDGIPAVAGDYIGVFYDSLGTEACAGYIEYDPTTNLALSAWGDDSQTNAKDGFDANELFTYKIWNSQTNEFVDFLSVTYNTGFPNLDEFATNGMSGISSMEALSWMTQYINLPEGWSIFSTYIDAFEPNLDSVFADIVANVIIVKDGFGLIYWPQWTINTIGSLTIGEGYQIKMLSTDTLGVTGLPVVPELTPIQIPQGWSIIGYLRQSPASIETMLNPIVSEIIIVKNGMGQVYWPSWGVNSIGNMNPGEGYHIKLSTGQTLTYPANGNFSKSEVHIEQAQYFNSPQNTGSNMTLGIPLSSWESLPDIGDEVGVFSQAGELFGSSVFAGGNMAITLWGDDEYSSETDGLIADEQFTVRIWNSENQSESEVLIEHWIEGDATYETTKIAVAGKVSSIEYQVSRFELFQNSPNPFKHETEFAFYLSEDCEVTFEIFNLLGECVETLHATSLLPIGKHTISYHSGSLPAGSYYYRLQSPKGAMTKKMTIVK